MIQPFTLSPKTLDQILELIESNYAQRDELYAAAATLTDHDRREVCERLAEHLAAHAAELEQILLANGRSRDELKNIDLIDHLSTSVYEELSRRHQGDGPVLNELEQGEQKLKAGYDKAMSQATEGEAQGVLERQREEVEFGESVLRSMQEPTSDDQAK